MNIKRMRNLAIELKPSNLNLKTSTSFMKEIFKARLNLRVRPNEITVKTHNTATYGDKSLTVLGPKIWNSFPENIKCESNYRRLKEYINTWLLPGDTAPVVNTLQERPRLLQTHIKLSNTKSDLHK